MTDEQIQRAERLLGYRFRDRDLLRRSLTHASVVDSRLESNERLEFLGDAVLGLIICEFLFERYSHLLEGDMTKIKSTVVSRQTCAEVADEMKLGDLLQLGKGMSNRATLPKSVIAAVYESVIGAVYIDGGTDAVRSLILGQMRRRVEDAARSGHQYNFKSVLQQAVQQQLDQAPLYIILDEKGPDHAKCFEVCVELGSRRFASSWGASKKEAEQQAAVTALLELGLAERDEDGEEIFILPVDSRAAAGDGQEP